jgi:hypothetical protein
MNFRDYRPDDHDACLALFRSNTLDFFGEGFATVTITENWYTDGLHRYDMRLTLDDERCSRVAQTSADLSRKSEP